VLALAHHYICCQWSIQGVVVGFGMGAKISAVLLKNYKGTLKSKNQDTARQAILPMTTSDYFSNILSHLTK
jgi:hypothetical protein